MNDISKRIVTNRKKNSYCTYIWQDLKVLFHIVSDIYRLKIFDNVLPYSWNYWEMVNILSDPEKENIQIWIVGGL